jgi:DNA-binding transcriptional regulator PaaX
MAYYKGIRVNVLGLPIAKKNPKDRIKKNNRKRKFYYTAFSSPFVESSPKNLILMYDVVEEKKKERDWFRRQLKNFGYIMIQRSVWVGPSPLPEEFIQYVKSVGLQDHLKSFKLAKPYTGKEKVFK